MDRDALCDAPTLQELWQSGLLKFFCTSTMGANVHLLELLIGYLDHDLRYFDLQGEILEITCHMPQIAKTFNFLRNIMLYFYYKVCN